jgi:hypothetical protein
MERKRSPMDKDEKIRPLIDTLPPSSRIGRVCFVLGGSLLMIVTLTSLVVWWWVKK